MRGLTAANCTCSIWEGFVDTMRNIAQWLGVLDERLAGRDWVMGADYAGGLLLSRSRPGAVRGLLCRLQLEDRIPRREIVERFHRRSFGDREETLHLAGEAIKIGLIGRNS